MPATTRPPLHPAGSIRYVRRAGPKVTIGMPVVIDEARPMGGGEYRYRGAGLWFYEEDLTGEAPEERARRLAAEPPFRDISHENGIRYGFTIRVF